MTTRLRVLALSVLLFAFSGCHTLQDSSATPRPESVGLQISYSDGRFQAARLRSRAEFLIRDHEHPVLGLSIIHAHNLRQDFDPAVIELARRKAAPDNDLLVVTSHSFTFQSASRPDRFGQHRP